MAKQKPKGVIIWDFDRVLFDAERYHLDIRKAFIELGIPLKVILGIVNSVRREKRQFSIAEFMRGLRARKILLPEKTVRRVFHEHLLRYRYYDKSVDSLLHRLRKKGFQHIIVGLGNASFQYKKIEHCGSSLRRHFAKIYITGQEKYLLIQKIQNRHRDTPIIFIDDTKSHLDLAQKHLRGVTTIHYSNVSGHALKKLEREILKHAK